MTERPQNDVETWLRAEACGASDDAERALTGLMRSLPLLSPSRGFAARVLGEARLAAARRADVFAGRGVRWAIAAGLVLAAASLLAVPALLQPLASSISLAGLLASLAQLLVVVGRWIGGGAAFWRVAGEVGSAVALAVSKPPVAMMLFAMVAASAAALRALNRLMSPERSAAHG